MDGKRVTADVKSLIPIVDRLRARFGIGRICIVADRGMISQRTIAELQKKVRDVRYILGVRMRLVKEIREVVLSDPSPFESVYGSQQTRKDPSPLEVKEVQVQSRRYIVCRNEDQARKDVADRQAIVKSLREQLKRGDKTCVRFNSGAL